MCSLQQTKKSSKAHLNGQNKRYIVYTIIGYTIIGNAIDTGGLCKEPYHIHYIAKCQRCHNTLEYYNSLTPLVIPPKSWEKIQFCIGEYGLKHCDLPTMISNVAFMLRLSALNIDSRSNEPVTIMSCIITLLFTSCYTYVYVVSMVWFVLVKCRETGDLLSALVVFSLGIASEIAFTKYVLILLRRATVRSVLAEFLACDALPALSVRYSENLARTLREVKKRALIFCFVIYMNCVLYILKPYVQPGRHVMEDFFILYGLEPMFETPNYEIALFTLSASTVIIGHLTSNITSFHIIITGYVEAQMVALAGELTHLWDDVQNDIQNVELNRRKEALNKSIKEGLSMIAKRHAVILSLHKRVENLFRGVIAVEFLLLVLALVAELLGGLKNTYMEVPFALMLVATDCWTGQKVVDASDAFEASVYDSKWENFDKENMKTIFLMQLVSQRTLTMTAGGVAMLDLACFMAINKYIYSTYTTLESFMT